MYMQHIVTIYSTFIKQHIDYCVNIWSCTCNTLLQYTPHLSSNILTIVLTSGHVHATHCYNILPHLSSKHIDYCVNIWSCTCNTLLQYTPHLSSNILTIVLTSGHVHATHCYNILHIYQATY